jgi:hypothetical protein
MYKFTLPWKQSILNIGSGKLSIDSLRNDKDKVFRVCVDRSYNVDSCSSIGQMEDVFVGNTPSLRSFNTYYCNLDIFQFLGQYKFKFDKIYAHRIFEHMFYDSGEIGYLLSSLWSVANFNCELEIIVPNLNHIVELIQKCEQSGFYYNENLLLINTELHNSRQDAHGSSWTPILAKQYIEQEGTWRIQEISDHIIFEGRSIYMKILCKRLQ